MKPFWISLILLVIAVPAVAAPFDKFLSSAWADPRVALQQENLKEYGDSSGFKPIEAMQIRLSQNEVIEDRKIALRLHPRGFTQDRMISALSSGQNRIEKLNLQAATTQALHERYKAASSYAIALETHRLWSSISGLRTKRLSMLQIAARSSQTRAADLIKQRGDAEQAEVKASLAASDLKIATLRMKALDPSFNGGPVDLAALPTPSEMLKIVGDTSADSAFGAKLARENAARAHDALKYEIAKDDRLIDFVEVSYAEAKVSKDQEYGVSLSFNIPGFASSELNRSEKARELVKYEVEAREAARRETLAQAEARESLSMAAELYKSLASISDRPSEKRLRQVIGQQDPLLGLTVLEEGLAREIRQQEIALKAYESYFNFLAMSGTLAARAHTNFLSKKLSEIN